MLDRGKASSYTEQCRSSREVELPGRVNGRLHHEAKEALQSEHGSDLIDLRQTGEKWIRRERNIGDFSPCWIEGRRLVTQNSAAPRERSSCPAE